MYAHSSSARSAHSTSPVIQRRESITSPDENHHHHFGQQHSHIVHNPYPPPPPRDTPGRRMSAVLAAVASSDLEYSGIMPPPSDAVFEDGGRPRSASGSGYHSHRHSLADLPPPRGATALTPSYASSSERQPSIESTRHAGTPASPRRSPWEQGYRDTLNAGIPPAPATTASSAPSESPVEPPKKRRRKAQAANGSDIPEGAEVEYEDASGDPSRGPVFIHPPKGSVQACVRCHRIKRKCDGLWPRCKSCERSDVACVFELSAATSR